ncbi:hypothetical protein E1B28_001207 [Marasmius oreades]|uniref:Uncharacterized protein n=1 Tax=Marasmius oreades TaxID=181124 RepID=A0A9P7V2X3_9AGAR|nr:uncharacterized protein E1B28_001207 [Marasmius oreades]KAG7099351.1 hypothetical protein E1B28_001207 [Marasmius oreades]
MPSFRLTNHRRRSQSAATPPSHRITDSSRLGSVRRSRPHSSHIFDFSSSCNRGLETWKTRKRRRDFSCSGLSSDDDIHEDDPEMDNDACMIFDRDTPTPAFAATSAEFHLSPRPGSRPRHSAHDTLLDSENTPTLHELSSLRSNAFWELQRSVMENGEGLVRRMRDYERTRSRADTYIKVKDASKREKKRSSLISFDRRATSPLHDECDDDDDIQIYSGDVPQPFPRREVRHKISSGSDTLMDAWSAPSSERCSSPSSFYMTDEEHLVASDINAHNSVSGTLGSSPSGFGGKNSTHPSFINSSRSEKAIAALTLALANGSAGLNDYEALRNLQPVLALDDSQVGEMWQ